MGNYIENYNQKLNYLKENISNLYNKNLDLLLKLQDQSFITNQEIDFFYENYNKLGDDFYYFNKIKELNSLIYDNNGFTLLYSVKDVSFKKDYLNLNVFSINMTDSQMISGSDFKQIFKINMGFWGYSAPAKTPFSFTLELEEKSLVNKLRINTNNELLLKVYAITEDSEVDLGECDGLYHAWDFEPIEAYSYRIEGTSNLISLSYVETGLALYDNKGYFISEPYYFDNPYKISLETNQTTTINNFIDYNLIIEDKEYAIKDTILLDKFTKRNNSVFNITDKNTTIDDSTYFRLNQLLIPESIRIRYNKGLWTHIDRNDYEEEYVSSNVDNSYGTWSKVENKEYTYNYKIVDVNTYYIEYGCLKQLMLGDTVLIEGQDYTIDYSKLSENAFNITFLQNKVAEESFADITLNLLLKRKVHINIYKSYVFLENDAEIFVDFPYSYNEEFNLIYKHIDNSIKEVSKYNYDTKAISELNTINNVKRIIINGKKGINLIEIKPANKEQTFQSFLFNISNYDYYGYKYEGEKSSELTNVFQYKLTKVEDLYSDSDLTNYYQLYISDKIYDEDSDIKNIDVEYLTKVTKEPIGISLKATFYSINRINAPKLLSYQLSNSYKI